MKTEHVQAIVRTIRRMQPADLILPIGALLVSAGVQRLVDREDRQRQRLTALAELVDDHRQTLEANGVELPVDRFGDETHPLDIELAVQTVLARTPTEPDNRITDNPNPVKRPRFRRALTILGLAGAAGATVWGRGYARTYGQEPTLSGFLSAWRGPDVGPATPFPATSSESSDPNSSGPDGNSSRAVYPEHAHAYGEGTCPVCGAGGVAGAQLLDPVPPPGPSDCVGAPECGHTLGHEDSDRWTGGDKRDEDVIGRGVPPIESCGWPLCDWSSDATRSEMGQRTQAAIHRNKCIYRPAGAVVDGLG